MSEPEPDKRTAKRGGKGLPRYVYEPGGEFRRRREGRRGNGVKNRSGSEAIPNVSGPNPHKMEENHFALKYLRLKGQSLLSKISYKSYLTLRGQGDEDQLL